MESESRRLLPSELYPAGYDDVVARFVTLKSGLRVRVVEAGDPGANPVVLVPGWGCGAWIFHEILPRLASSGFRAFAVELKGHGFSDKPDDPREYTVEAMRDHLAEILDALELKNVSLIGHSMGAAIAVQLSAVDTGRISSVIIAAPVGFAGVPGMGFFRFITPAFALPALQFLTTRFLIRTMLSVVYGSIRRASSRDVEEFYAPSQMPGFVRSLRYLLHEFDWHRTFPPLSIPTMAIFGSEDVLSPSRDAADYPADPAIVVKGAGHVLFEEAPGVVNGAITRFLRERVYISNKHE